MFCLGLEFCEVGCVLSFTVCYIYKQHLKNRVFYSLSIKDLFGRCLSAKPFLKYLNFKIKVIYAG